MPTAKAVRIHHFGGPEVLQLDDITVPPPEDDQVIIRIHAASENPVDYKIREGSYPAITEDQLPVVLGRDVSGVVEICGPSVHTLKKGDPVFAMVGKDRGTYADRVMLLQTELAAKPQSLDHIHAAAVPLAAMTAWQGLFDHGGLQSGQRVLIHGGAGGVGHLAVQFAKARGAHVFTTVSAKDIDFVRQLGVDEAIDYKSQRFEDVARDIDLVLDLIAGETQDRSWSVLKPNGALISTLQKPDEAKARECKVRATNYMAQPNAAQLNEVGRLIDAGEVRVHVDRVFPLAEAQQAQAYLENEHVRGKVVLRVAE